MSDIKDLLSTSLEQKPSDFGDHLKNILLDKISTAIDNRKSDLARTMFSGDSDIDTEDFETEDQPESEEENV